MKYRFLEDVALADIAYEAFGKDLNETFENAALAIFELSAELKTVEAKKKIDFEIENETLDNLLYDFLSEILFLKDSCRSNLWLAGRNWKDSRTRKERLFFMNRRIVC